jgi:hypothetical protein
MANSAQMGTGSSTWSMGCIVHHPGGRDGKARRQFDRRASWQQEGNQATK